MAVRQVEMLLFSFFEQVMFTIHHQHPSIIIFAYFCKLFTSVINHQWLHHHNWWFINSCFTITTVYGCRVWTHIDHHRRSELSSSRCKQLHDTRIQFESHSPIINRNFPFSMVMLTMVETWRNQVRFCIVFPALHLIKLKFFLSGLLIDSYLGLIFVSRRPFSQCCPLQSLEPTPRTTGCWCLRLMFLRCMSQHEFVYLYRLYYHRGLSSMNLESC